ncbi:MAG: hypothetical protein HC916_15715 [Coleofasciculaceae cyanobacterium SM2_1_6]|nr:hypothetical protein [Coleofasciculaceae cyanobacterium SM2_1_6]
MLAQLRLQYPDSCLITELLMIKHGKYVVKAEVRMAGLTIATSMGAADTIELAEDRARERVLAVVGLGVNPVSSPAVIATLRQDSVTIPSPITGAVLPEITPPESGNPQLKTPEAMGQNPVAPQGEVPTVVAGSDGSTEVKTLKIQETEDQKAESQRLKTPITQIQEPEMAKGEEPKPEMISAEFETVAVSQGYTEAPLLTIAPEIPSPEKKPEKSEKVVPLHVVTNGSIAPQSSQSDQDHSVATLELPEIAPEKPEKVKATPETMPDIKDVMAKTEIEIRRLGWTTQQGRNFLLQRYGKRARTLLSDEELFDFLEYLESQA